MSQSSLWGLAFMFSVILVQSNTLDEIQTVAEFKDSNAALSHALGIIMRLGGESFSIINTPYREADAVLLMSEQPVGVICAGVYMEEEDQIGPYPIDSTIEPKKTFFSS